LEFNLTQSDYAASHLTDAVINFSLAIRRPFSMILTAGFAPHDVSGELAGSHGIYQSVLDHPEQYFISSRLSEFEQFHRICRVDSAMSDDIFKDSHTIFRLFIRSFFCVNAVFSSVKSYGQKKYRFQ